MLYAGMTFLASLVWSIICFMIYLLLECDGGMITRWFAGMLVISMYRPAIGMTIMTTEQWKSLLFVVAGAASAALAVLLCLYCALGG